jgi:hypothetical protein
MTLEGTVEYGALETFDRVLRTIRRVRVRVETRGFFKNSDSDSRRLSPSLDFLVGFGPPDSTRDSSCFGLIQVPVRV